MGIAGRIIGSVVCNLPRVTLPCSCSQLPDRKFHLSSRGFKKNPFHWDFVSFPSPTPCTRWLMFKFGSGVFWLLCTCSEGSQDPSWPRWCRTELGGLGPPSLSRGCPWQGGMLAGAVLTPLSLPGSSAGHGLRSFCCSWVILVNKFSFQGFPHKESEAEGLGTGPFIPLCLSGGKND